MGQDLRRPASRYDAAVCVISMDELQRLWIAEVHGNRITLEEAKQLWASWRKAPAFAAQYAATADDIALAAKLVKDLGRFGARVRFQRYGGRLHVIFKGYPGLRRILRGTKYLATNPKVVQMGVGRAGAVRAMRQGALLTVVLVTAFRVFDYLMSDHQTLGYLLGSLATDFLKIGASAAAAVAAIGVAAGTAAGTFAVGPLIVGIVIGVGVAWVLDAIDQRNGITQQLIEAMDRAGEQAQWRLDHQIDQIQEKAMDLAGEAVDMIVSAILREAEGFLRKQFPRVVWISG